MKQKEKDNQVREIQDVLFKFAVIGVTFVVATIFESFFI